MSFNVNSVYSLKNLKLGIDSNIFSVPLTTTSWEFNSTQYRDGLHVLSVIATDLYGNQETGKVFVYFNNAKILSLLNLENNSYVYGSITLQILYPYETYTLVMLLNDTVIYNNTQKPEITVNTSKYPDGKYYLKILAYDTKNNLIGSTVYSITILNALLPSPELNVSDYFDYDGKILLEWTDVGASYYRIYRSYSNGPWQLLTETIGTSFWDYVSDGSWRYKVVPIDIAGKPGNESNVGIANVYSLSYAKKVVVDRIYKPNDIAQVKFYTTVPYQMNLSLVQEQLGINKKMTYLGATIYGYAYSTNFTVPNANGTYEFKINDNISGAQVASFNITIDNNAPEAMLELASISSTGFLEFNKSVTSYLLIFFDVSATEDVKCKVGNGLLEEFSNVTLEKMALPTMAISTENHIAMITSLKVISQR